MGLAESVPIRRRLKVAQIFGLPPRSVNKGTQHTHSQGELIRSFPDDRSREFSCEPWSYHFLGPCFPVQISNFHCCIIVDITQFPHSSSSLASTHFLASRGVLTHALTVLHALSNAMLHVFMLTSWKTCLLHASVADADDADDACWRSQTALVPVEPSAPPRTTPTPLSLSLHRAGTWREGAVAELKPTRHENQTASG